MAFLCVLGPNPLSGARAARTAEAGQLAGPVVRALGPRTDRSPSKNSHLFLHPGIGRVGGLCRRALVPVTGGKSYIYIYTGSVSLKKKILALVGDTTRDGAKEAGIGFELCYD